MDLPTIHDDVLDNIMRKYQEVPNLLTEREVVGNFTHFYPDFPIIKIHCHVNGVSNTQMENLANVTLVIVVSRGASLR
jgi:hypothetical protein